MVSLTPSERQPKLNNLRKGMFLKIIDKLKKNKIGFTYLTSQHSFICKTKILLTSHDDVVQYTHL